MSITATAFFGDQERPFTLTDELVVELEATTGAGIGTLYQRLLGHAFKLADLAEVIRLGLIGAGTNPEEAARLVNSYARNRPVAEVLPLATAILAARWLGADEVQADG
ncbi:MAG TPA: gene transfer agent family protein [Paracoccus sp. (in: a-proteobacteria)]|uniref:gene transfer agent family protein n=1 Tax=Paracoccus sp. TaxID=267 RepID=UPI002BA8376B|nr:gene transfer agent family protein [Paracoccus sp. (in: a-proteobacteria)]HWL55468.1 gene transfer agent family protein [Paracoccus sp. (in: a-proteobacteria)]